MQNVQQFNEETLTKNIIAQRSPVTGNTIFYAHVHKQSQSGLLYNERMLVIEDRHCTLFYSKYLRPIDRLVQLQKKGKEPIKQYLHVVNTHAQRQGSVIIVRFIKGNIKKGWSFRFYSEDLAIKWYTLYKQIYEKSLAKSLSKSKQTASDEQSYPSEYASILSHSKMHEMNERPPAYNSVTAKKSIKLQLKEHLIAQSERTVNKKMQI